MSPSSENDTETAEEGDDRVARLLARYDELLRSCSPETDWTSDSPIDPELSRAMACLRLLKRAWQPLLANDSDAPITIGKFVVERVLGRGGFGVVYRARDTLLNRAVALKIPWPHALDKNASERFLTEARAAAQLDHPNIVPTYETGMAGQVCYIASAYCHGQNLAELLATCDSSVPMRWGVELVEQLADAMAYSHERGILHRDLKPSNVMLVRTDGQAGDVFGEKPKPRLTDFGLAKLLGESLALTTTTAVMGTPLYMSPEQATGKRDAIGPPTDVYSLGAMLYELLTGRTPFVGETPLEVLDQVRQLAPNSIRKFRTELPRDLDAICQKCLQKRPEDRYTANELAAELGRFLAGKSITVRRPSIVLRIWRWCQLPARIRTAGEIMMFVNIAIVAWMWANEVGFGFRWMTLPPQVSFTSSVVGCLVLTVVLHGPQLLFGWQSLAMRSWAVIGGLTASLLQSSYLVAAVIGVALPPFEEYYSDPLPRALIFSMIMTLTLLQLAMYLLSIPAVAFGKHNRR